MCTSSRRTLDTRKSANGTSAIQPPGARAELDEAEELDDGNPVEFGEQYRRLMDALPGMAVLGGVLRNRSPAHRRGRQSLRGGVAPQCLRSVAGRATGLRLVRLAGKDGHFDPAVLLLARLRLIRSHRLHFSQTLHVS